MGVRNSDHDIGYPTACSYAEVTQELKMPDSQALAFGRWPKATDSLISMSFLQDKNTTGSQFNLYGTLLWDISVEGKFAPLERAHLQNA